MARPTLSSHPKFARLAAVLRSRALARGVLELLWESCYASGNPSVGDAVSLEAVADWRGKAGVLAQALSECRFLDSTALPDGRTVFEVHDLEDHAPDYVLKRWERERKRQEAGQTIRSVRQEAARAKWMQTDATDRRLQNGVSHLQANVLPPAPAPAPNTDQNGGECGETAKPSSPPAPVPVPIDSVLVFPCDGAPREWHLTRKQVAEWRELFPRLDMGAECRAALAWIKADPNRKKTASGMKRFLVSWFTRTQNRTPPQGAPVASRPAGPTRMDTRR